LKRYYDFSPQELEAACLRFLTREGVEEAHARLVAEWVWPIDEGILSSSIRTERVRNAMRRLEKKELVASESRVTPVTNGRKRWYRRAS